VRRDDLYELPKGLPVPQDDGACKHLAGMTLPPIGLPSTRGRVVDLARLVGTTVIYIYPRTGRPDREVPTGWNAIPGARGCTPQSCAFRDHYAELKRAGAANVFGLSTQDTAYQREAAERLHLPFELLSDAGLRLAGALNLPTFEVDGMKLIKRITLIAREAAIVKVFYPVFPPDRNAGDVLAWLTAARDDELREISDED
jgi:peroxiredoxin